MNGYLIVGVRIIIFSSNTDLNGILENVHIWMACLCPIIFFFFSFPTELGHYLPH